MDAPDIRKALTNDTPADLSTKEGRLILAYRHLDGWEQNMLAVYMESNNNYTITAERLGLKYSSVRSYISSIRKKIRNMI